MPKYNQEIRDIYAGATSQHTATDDFSTEDTGRQHGNMDEP